MGYFSRDRVSDYLPDPDDLPSWRDARDGAARIADAVEDASPSAVEISRGLGWFSILLGLAELFGGRGLARGIGMTGMSPVFRAYGLREIAVGVGLLANPRSPTLMWGRVAGDVLDIATLAGGLPGYNKRRGALGVALATVLLVTVVDIAVAQRLERDR